MEKIKIVEFNVRHLEVMEVRDVEAFGCLQLTDAFDRIDRMGKASIQAWTFMYEGRILFCAGFYKLFPGVGEAWMIPSKYARTAPIYFARTLKHYVENIAEDFRLHRFQTTSPDDPFHERFMTWLGFKKEGTMEKFTHDKKNYCIYARIF